MDIKKVILGNSFLIISKNILNHLVKLGTKLIIARLLLPEDFGLVSLVITILDILSLLGSLGSNTFIVRNKIYPEKEALSNAFVLNFSTNLLLLFLLLISTPLLSDFLNKPNLMPLLRFFSIYLLITPFYNTAHSLLEKRVHFKKICIAELTGIAVYSILAILLCTYHRSYWMLLLSHYISILTVTILLLIFSKFSISFQTVQFKVILDIIQFGKYVLGHSFVVFSKNQYDNLVVAKFLSSKALGYYVWAFAIATLPILIIIHAVNSVIFPVYCHLQDQKDDLIRVLYQTGRAVLIFFLPLISILATFTQTIIFFLLGEKWLPICPVLKVLCLYTILRCLLAIVSPVFTAIGKPKITFYASAISLTLGFALIPILVSRMGIVGAGMAITIGLILDSIIIFTYLVKEFPQARSHNRELLPLLIINLILYILFHLSSLHLSSYQILGPQLLTIFIGLLLYGGMMYKIEHEIIKKISHTIQSKLKTLLQRN